MKTTELKTMLSSYGYKLDEWTILDKFTHVALNSDNKLFLSKESVELYFDSNGLFYIRIFDGSNLMLCEAVTTVPEGMTKIKRNEKYYLAKLIPGFYKTTSDKIGYIHTIMSQEYISGFIDESMVTKMVY